MDMIVMGGVPWQQTLYASMRGEKRLGGCTQAFLALASQGYRVARWGHALSYTAGLRRQHRLPCRVVSIGNLTLGGTGKTPLTLWMARWFQHQGWRVAVLSRGYGGYGTGETRVVSEGRGPVCSWSEVGDEPYLLAQELPGVPVLVGACRVLSGRVACEQFGAQVVLLDDGFQHRALQREMDMVLIDATNPFGHGALVPRGNLREPLAVLRRASALVLARTELAGETLPGLITQLRRWHGQRPIYHMQTVVEALWHVGDQRCEDVTVLHRQRVVAFAGIGNPDAFAATLQQLGCEVAALLVFPDHHRYTVADWRAILDLARQYGGECVVTTTKDAIRLESTWRASIPLYTVRIDVTFAHDEKPLTTQLQALLDDAGSGA